MRKLQRVLTVTVTETLMYGMVKTNDSLFLGFTDMLHHLTQIRNADCSVTGCIT